jgi:hypothetical protein
MEAATYLGRAHWLKVVKISFCKRQGNGKFSSLSQACCTQLTSHRLAVEPLGIIQVSCGTRDVLSREKRKVRSSASRPEGAPRRRSFARLRFSLGHLGRRGGEGGPFVVDQFSCPSRRATADPPPRRCGNKCSHINETSRQSRRESLRAQEAYCSTATKRF